MQYLFSTRQWESKIVAARRIFLFLDFDGTLSPIVKHPYQAHILPSLKTYLRSLSCRKNIVIVIISGRHREDLIRRVGIRRGIIYFGWHGLKVRFRGKKRFLNTLVQIKAVVKKWRRHCSHLVKEDKEIILALHYRNLNSQEKECWQKLKKELARFAAAGSIQLGFGKKVLEIRPPQKFGKGEVVKELLKSKCRGREDLAIYIGDDLTDEEGFCALREKDLTIRVGYKKNSAARYFLRSTLEVEKVLGSLLNLKSEYN
ncbi:MAG: trehalose-phosphatase [Candidatus Omnitrophica bacterium]|nr:trehalose-phosphatase [Candidatus Omnitrophota bacterium]